MLGAASVARMPERNEHSPEGNTIDNDEHKQYISMLILSGFIAILGLAGVTLGLAILNTTKLDASNLDKAGIAAAGVGVALLALSLRFFAATAHRREADELSPGAGDILPQYFTPSGAT